MDSSLVPVRDVRPGLESACIRCRVICMWFVRSSKKSKDVDSMEFILVDKLVNRFYCC
jgi:hypothetical protein